MINNTRGFPSTVITLVVTSIATGEPSFLIPSVLTAVPSLGIFLFAFPGSGTGDCPGMRSKYVRPVRSFFVERNILHAASLQSRISPSGEAMRIASNDASKRAR